MPQTIVENLLSRASAAEATAGSIINARLSWLMINDAVGEATVDAFRQIGGSPWDPERIAVMLDHYVPASTEHAARVHRILRDFASEYGLLLFDTEGVCHQLMLEHFIKPGDIAIGTDSHTCTYGGVSAFGTGVGSTDGAAAMATGEIWLKVPESIRIDLHGALGRHVHAKDVILSIIGALGADGATYKALEFGGDGAEALSVSQRCTICNMAIEAGAKTGIFEYRESTTPSQARRDASEKHVPIPALIPDADAAYASRIEIELSEIEPLVACPYTVDNVKPAESLEHIRIDQAFIGSCTNGRIEDLRIAAAVLENERIHKGVRLLVTPASQEIYARAIDEGLIDTFLAAGAVICNPGCSACFGGQGMLWKGEVCIGTHNRNFRSRMGHRDSRVYLASPETVARSAIVGQITDPRSERGKDTI